MRAQEFTKLQQINEGKLVTDVPSDEWLQGKIEWAKKRGRDQWGAPYFGTTTAYVKGSPPVVSVLRLSLLRGLRNEQRNVRHQDLKWLIDYMGRTGKLPPGRNGDEYLPFITVAYNGEAWVSEGNHRIMAADQLGWTKMPVEIKYFDGGERIESGPMYPGKIGLGR